MPKSCDYQKFPYGAFLCADNSTVVFDRNYKPIVRVDNGPPILKVDVHTADRKKRRVQLSANATPVPANTRIEHVDQLWFYDDGTSPRHTPATRWLLADIVAKIPALANEIAAR